MCVLFTFTVQLMFDVYRRIRARTVLRLRFVLRLQLGRFIVWLQFV